MSPVTVLAIFTAFIPIYIMVAVGLFIVLHRKRMFTRLLISACVPIFVGATISLLLPILPVVGTKILGILLLAITLGFGLVLFPVWARVWSSIVGIPMFTQIDIRNWWLSVQRKDLDASVITAANKHNETITTPVYCVVVLILIVVTTLLVALAAFFLGQKLNPRVDVDFVTIHTALGAGAGWLVRSFIFLLYV